MTAQYLQTNINHSKVVNVYVNQDSPLIERTLTSSVERVTIESSDNDFAVTLPNSGEAPGQTIHFAFPDIAEGGNITLAAAAGDTIQGVASIVNPPPAGSPFQGLVVTSMFLGENGETTGWRVIASSVNAEI